MIPEPIDIPAIREVGILRLYLTPTEVSRLLTTLRARADVRVEDVRGPPYTAVRRVYVLHFEPEAIEVWQVEDHIGFRRDDTAPTDRRLQVIARLIDAAGMVAEDAKDLVAMTRADYPDVFADLDSHLRQVARSTLLREGWDAAYSERKVATTEPDATVIDEPADPAIWAQTSERAQAAALAGEPPPAMAGPYEVSERLQRLDEFVADPRTLEEALAEAAANVARLDRKRPPDADPLTGELPKRAALMPREIYVDDIIGGVPTVRLTPIDSEPITFSLSAEGARVLGLALLSSAEISKVTGWGAPTSDETQQRVRAAIPATVLESGGTCPCAECGGVLTVAVSVSGQDRAFQCSTASCVRWIE